ncbi:hypothetical protein KR018_002476 [Drosophila ironensis]|nr:hypothetical protein KR018_002476 [Drosophila ironensis]
MFFANIFLLCTVSCVLIAAQAPEILSGERLALAKLELEKSLFCNVVKVEGGWLVQGSPLFFTAELVDKNGTHKDCLVTMGPESNEVTMMCHNQPKVIN